eukprot:GILK01005636.1.p1 GENE.GILK01005636.1~~GILK01005636.1.p1  ORF type:complete len:280 (-),score=54.27 GILK01005636.1:125-964(-)
MVQLEEIQDTKVSEHEDSDDDIANETDKLQIPAKEKDAGNALFKKGEYVEAAKHYEKALLAIKLLFQDERVEDEKEAEHMVQNIKNPCHLNLALCFLKTGHEEAAIEHCNKVLEFQDSNVKALYRRGQARLKVGEIDDGKADLKRALQLEPSNAAVRQALIDAKEVTEKYREKQKELSKKMLQGLSSAESESCSGSALYDPTSYQKECMAKPGGIRARVTRLIDRVIVRSVALVQRLPAGGMVIKLANMALTVFSYMLALLWSVYRRFFSRADRNKKQT